MFLSLILLFIVNCNGNNSIQSSVKKNNDEIEFLRNFLVWYKSNLQLTRQSSNFVDLNSNQKGTYRINFESTERYLSILKLSGFFSNNYLNNQRKYFRQIDLNLQKINQNDGVVEDLDFDLITHSQEPEAILENINEIKFSIQKRKPNGTLLVKLKTPYDSKFSYSLIELIKTNKTFLIDNINFVTKKTEN